MPIVQTPYGPQPTLSLRGGSRTDLALPSVPFQHADRAGLLLNSGRTVSFANLWRTQPWVFATVNRQREQIARLPLKVYRTKGEKAEERERLRPQEHALAELLHRPRPGWRGLHLRDSIALSLLVHGHYVGWKRRRNRAAPPSEVWWLDWRNLIPRREGADGPIVVWEWQGEGIPGLRRGERIATRDIISIGWAAPDGDLGVSPLNALGVTLRSEDALQRYSEAAARNSVRVNVAAVLDPKVSADKVLRDGVREELIAAHTGDNAFRPAVLGGGIVDLKELGQQTAREAELIEQRKVNREEVAAAYGMPAPLVGILDHATYGNIEELHRMLYLTVLGPPCELISTSLEASLLDTEPAWGEDLYLEFDFGEVLKGATQERMSAYALALQNGVLTLNDVRRLENLPPYDDPRANEPLIAANNVKPLSAVGKEPDPPKLLLPPRPPGPPRDDEEDEEETVAAVVGRHAVRALERAARGVGAGDRPLEALNVPRLERELADDLEERAGMNGAGATLAQAVAAELSGKLEDAQTVEDVRDVERHYTGGPA